MSVGKEYMRWFEAQSKSGPLLLTEEHRRKNLLLYEKVKDLLPVDDDNKVNDCDLLYRFLIGSHWHVEKAEGRFRHYVTSRAEQKLNGILAEEVDPEIMQVMSTIYGKDNEGYPCIWMAPDPAVLTAIMKKFPRQSIVRGQMRVMEMARYIARDQGVDRTTYVFDLGKATISSITSQLISFMKDSMKMLQEFYPELMRRLLIYHTSWAVTGAWKVLKAFIDSRVQDKIKFDSSAPSIKSLANFIPPEGILPKYGGKSVVDDMGDILNAEVMRLRAKGQAPPPLPAPIARPAGNQKDEGPLGPLGGDSDDGEEVELHSLYTSFVTQLEGNSPTAAHADPMLVIGVQSVVDNRSADDAVAVAEQLRQESCINSPMSDEYDSPLSGSQVLQSGSPTGSPTGPPAPTVTTHVALMETGGGVLSGHIGARRFGNIERGTVFSSSGRRQVGRILVENGHPLHTVLLLTDAASRVKYIVSMNVLRRSVKVFTAGGRAVTDKAGRSFYLGERTFMGRLVADSGSTSKASTSRRSGAAWNLVRDADSTTDEPTSSASLRRRGAVIIAQGFGLSVYFYDRFAAADPQDLFVLAATLKVMWEDSVDANTSDGGMGIGENTAPSAGRGFMNRIGLAAKALFQR